jgi:hypothetical protein
VVSWFTNQALVGQILVSSDGMRRMSTTRQFDALRPLTLIAPVGGTGSTLSSFAYAWNALDQRTRMALAAGSYWVYEYL